MNYPPFLDLAEQINPGNAHVLLLPLPFEGTVCQGKGTADGPLSIWQASTHIEYWDEETGFSLDELAIHSARPVIPEASETPENYLERVTQAAGRLRSFDGLLIGIGGEHSLTPALVQAAVDRGLNPSRLTVVQFDAHADLRSAYSGTPYSHACSMRRLVEMGAAVLAVGIRSADQDETSYGLSTGLVETYYAHDLARGASRGDALVGKLRSLSGPVYLTFDIDALEVHLCSATGTPQPGGLGWWQALAYLRALLGENDQVELVGADLVEVAPSRHGQVNEMVAARLICKMLAYWFSSEC